MVKSVLCILTATTIAGIAFSTTAASAAPRPAALAYSSTPDAASGDPDTTVTFTVNVGGLTMTAPASADLASGDPGTNIVAALGAVVVTDARALLAASWDTTASATSWTTGTHTAAETIAASLVAYDPGTPFTTGTITTAGTKINLSGTATTVVAGTNGIGNNTATWNPTMTVAVPAAAVGGLYTGTLTQSVS
jgi:hypothetical protein